MSDIGDKLLQVIALDDAADTIDLGDECVEVIVVIDACGLLPVKMASDLPSVEIGCFYRQHAFVMPEDRLAPQPAAHLRSDICCYELVPLDSVFPDATLVIEHPIHRSLDVSLVHERSERHDDIVETKKIWAVDFR